MSGELLNAIGASSAVFLASAGSAYASAHSGRFALRAHRNLGLKSLVFIIISGVLAIYGLIVGVLLVQKFEGVEPISDSEGCRYLAAGLLVGFACLCSGIGMGLFLQPPRHHGPLPPFPPPPPATASNGGGDGEESAGNGGITEPLLFMMRSPPPPPPVPIDGKGFVTMVLVFIFLEAIGLYGLIVALFAIGK
mmetsp:Transcript_33318/g.98265  ORF Transcript_33318/g.98265 Transcript_33318/m.98265 type:complete len:193 (-) Transcript_33318:191-769(-)